MREKLFALLSVMSLVWLAGCPGGVTEPDRPALVDRRVSTPGELEELGLRVLNEDDQALLNVIAETVLEGVEENDYLFLFSPALPATAKPLIVDPDGAPLVAVRRMVKQEPLCTTWVDVALRDGETVEGYGGRIGAATRGICGGIAAMHSLLLLESVRRNEVINGDFFSERPLRLLQGADRTQMSKERLRELHEAGGATTCQMPGGVGFRTDNPGGLRRFNRELSEKVNDPDNTWDCTVFYQAFRDGKAVLAHFEHVESVTGGEDATTINTTNGLDQGNMTDEVPVSPGTNTWSSNPGGSPPFRLTGSTHPDAGDYTAGIPPAEIVNYLCCRK